MTNVHFVSLFASIVSVGQWVMLNWPNIAATLLVIIGSASALIKSLEVLVKLLVTIFPLLRTIDGRLVSIAAWLDTLSKSHILNGIAASPAVAFKSVLNPSAKLVDNQAQQVAACPTLHTDAPVRCAKPKPTLAAGGTIVALLFALLAAAPAHAQVISSGPSLPMLEFQPGNTHPVAIAPGAGYMLTVGFFQRALMGQQWDMLNISGAGFGTALASPNGVPAGQLQVALEIGTLNNILAAGVAVPIYGADNSGIFQGSFKVYPVLSLNIPIGFSPSTPPQGVQDGPRGLPRGGTLYFGPHEVAAAPAASPAQPMHEMQGH